MTTSNPTIAEAAGTATRFTDYSVPDAGIRAIVATESVWQAWLDVEAALAAAEADVGIVPRAAAEQIERVARLDQLDRGRIETAFGEQAHPVMPLVAELARVAGPEAGGWVHWGATSQNITHTGGAILVARAHRVVGGLLDRVLAALAEVADRGADQLMAGRTHAQHAVPITFGLKVATWIEDLLGCRDRLDAGVRPRLTAMTGGAAGTFASLGQEGPRVQDLVAERLGLDSMSVPSRALLTPQAGYIGDVGVLAAAAARIALDIETLMQTEIAEVSEPVPTGSIGSSTMPHKRNPKLSADILDLSSHLRALVPEALGATVHPGEADGAATAILDRLTHETLVGIGDVLVRLVLVVEGLEVRPERMRHNLRAGGGVLGSEAVMLALGETIGRDRAHSIVYDLAMRAVVDGEDFEGLLLDEPDVVAVLSPAQVHELLDPGQHLGLSAAIAHESAARARARTEAP